MRRPPCPALPCPALPWNDTRSAPQAALLVTQFGARAWADAVGSVPVASFTVTKLAWLAEHEPDAAARQAAWALIGGETPPTWEFSGVTLFEADPVPAVRERYASVRKMTATRCH
jgi:xylulokinase